MDESDPLAHSEVTDSGAALPSTVALSHPWLFKYKSVKIK